MSGGVGPISDDINLLSHAPDSATTAESDRKSVNDNLKAATASPRHRFLSFRQLNALAAAIVLAASGLVGGEDLAFSLFSLAYIYFLSSTAFPSDGRHHAPVFTSRLLTPWVAAGALVGLILPIAYILEGVVEGDKEGIRAAAPHVFLLTCQIFAEGITFSRGFSLPMRAFVPIFFNAKRMITLGDWLKDEMGKEVAEVGHLHGASPHRQLVGRGLAVANLMFWAVNLFGFLLPVYLPRALNRYYGVAAAKAKN